MPEICQRCDRRSAPPIRIVLLTLMYHPRPAEADSLGTRTSPFTHFQETENRTFTSNRRTSSRCLGRPGIGNVSRQLAKRPTDRPRADRSHDTPNWITYCRRSDRSAGLTYRESEQESSGHIRGLGAYPSGRGSSLNGIASARPQAFLHGLTSFAICQPLLDADPTATREFLQKDNSPNAMHRT